MILVPDDTNLVSSDTKSIEARVHQHEIDRGSCPPTGPVSCDPPFTMATANLRRQDVESREGTYTMTYTFTFSLIFLCVASSMVRHVASIATRYRKRARSRVSHRAPSHRTPALVGRNKQASSRDSTVLLSRPSKRSKHTRFTHGHESRIVFMTPQEHDDRRRMIMKAVIDKGRRLTAPSATEAKHFCMSV